MASRGWAASLVDFLMKDSSKCLTLSGLQGIFAMKMTLVDDFEQFFDVNGRRWSIQTGVLQAINGIFGPRPFPKGFGCQNRSKNVQKIC
jgi:hypothetical protein